MLEQVRAQWRYLAAAVALIIVAVGALAAGVSVLAQGNDGARQPITVNAEQGAVAGEAAAGEASPGVAQPSDQATPRPPQGATYHTVAAGETLGTIATAYGLTTAAIANANGLANPNMIVVGQRLIIPAR